MLNSIRNKIRNFITSFHRSPEIILDGQTTILKTLSFKHINYFTELVTEEISRHTNIPYPFRGKEARQYMKRMILMQKKGSGYYFTIFSRINNKVIGTIRIWDIDYTNKCAELGTWLVKESRGTGINKEVKDLILDFGFRDLNLNRIYCYVNSDNPQSIKQFEKLDFTFEGTLRESWFYKNRYVDRMLFSLLRKDFKK